MRLGDVLRIEGGREGDARFGGVVAERRAEGGFALFRYYRMGAGAACLKEPAGSAADERGAAAWLAREGCDCATFVHATGGGAVRPVWQRLAPWLGEARTKEEGERTKLPPAETRKRGEMRNDAMKRAAAARREPVQALLFEEGPARRIA